jgi:DNA-binding transcriptional MerR regulator
MTKPIALWTIADLTAQAALALSADYEGSANGRVRDVPDRRTIRYYTTLGLLDRPAEMRGRTALYGKRHLLQLVAIKRLQARGLSLAEIQQQLLGATGTVLQRLAQLPAVMEDARPPIAGARLRETSRQAFWRETPAPPSPAQIEENAPVTLHGVPLDEGVTVLFGAARPLYEDDVQALRSAAGPLLKLLVKRRLIRPRQEGDNHDQAARDPD